MRRILFSTMGNPFVSGYKISRHVAANRPWLVTAFGIGILAFLLLLPVSMHTRAKVLIAWNVTQWFYIARIMLLMFRAGPEHIRRRAREHEETADVVIAFLSVATLMALGGIVFEIISGKNTDGTHKLLHIALPAVTLIGNWLLIPLIFAVNYAHGYYCAPAEKKPLRFPDDIEHPSYLDFAYFAITIAVASQTADIAVTNSQGRKFVLVQSIFSFVFNTAILGLTINLAAGILD